MSTRCRWFAGRVAPKTEGERVAESMGTGVYAVGPHPSRAALAKALRFPGATAIIRGER